MKKRATTAEPHLLDINKSEDPKRSTSTGNSPHQTPDKAAVVETTEEVPPSGLDSLLSLGEREDFVPADNEVFLPIHEFVWFTDQEIAVINHPAFQRLGEINQLGQSHLVYRGATHKRLEHSLGTLHVAQMMIDAIEANHARLLRRKGGVSGAPLAEPFSVAERTFIRLAALLHDIGHLPAGHTLEDELELIPKHDERARLDLVLDRTDWPGAQGKTLRQTIDTEYGSFRADVDMPASELLIRIIAKDDSVPQSDVSGFRVSVCRDIVGNTICADLLDYLYRDWYHIGKPKFFEKRIFQYMEIRKKPDGTAQFVLSMGGRPRMKTDGVSVVLDLLESRYQLAEAVLFHRTKCSAAAMLERGIQELASLPAPAKSRPWVNGLEKRFLDYSDVGVLKTLLHDAEELNCDSAKLPLNGLRIRQLYKPIYTTFYSERSPVIAKRLVRTFASGASAAKTRLDALRMLEEDFNLPRGALVMYCPNKGMNSKIAKVAIHLDGAIETFEEWDRDNEHTLGGGHLGAQMHRFTRLWRAHVFMHHDEIAKMPEPVLRVLKRAVKELLLGIHDQPAEEVSESLALFAAHVQAGPFQGKEIIDRDRAARRERERLYPFGAPMLKSFFAQ